jgi:DNA-binding transcriptional MerR regulator
VEKAPDAFRTISEVAQELDVPQHVLRFWESRFREIRPMKRGGGRRYYRPDDVDLLRGIRHLLYGEGYTIRGVQRLLREQGVRFVQGVWQPGALQPSHAPSDDATEAALEPKAARAPRLPRAHDEDVEDDDEAPPVHAPRRESPAPAPAGLAPRGPAAPNPPASGLPASGLPASGLGREDAQKLQAALHELAECRQLLDAALAGKP